MSWYLFQNSPERQIRGKKVEGFQKMHKTKVILDWGLGQLSPKKQDNKKRNEKEQNENQNKKTKSLYEPTHENKFKKQQKIKVIQQAIKILTQSSSQQQQQKQQLIKVLSQYKNHKNATKIKEDLHLNSNQNEPSYQMLSMLNKQQNNKNNKNHNSKNILNDFDFSTDYDDKVKNKRKNNLSFINIRNNNNNTNSYVISSNNHPQLNNTYQKTIDSQALKRIRFLENSLLPLHKQDNITAVLDYDLNQQVSNQNSYLNQSRISGKSHFANKVYISFYYKLEELINDIIWQWIQFVQPNEAKNKINELEIKRNVLI